MKKITILLSIFTAFMVSCNSESTTQKTEESEATIENELQTEDNQPATPELSSDLMGIFELTMINQPLPLKVMEMINKYDGDYSIEIQPPVPAAKLSGSYIKNITLGIYGTHLIYSIEKENYSKVPQLLNEVNTLTDELGFPELINAETLDYFEANKNNSDSLNLLAISTFENLSSQLKDNGQIEKATLIMAASKIEAIKFAVFSTENGENKDELIQEALKEYNALSELLNILEVFESNSQLQDFVKKAKTIQTELKKETLDLEFFKTFEL